MSTIVGIILCSDEGHLWEYFNPIQTGWGGGGKDGTRGGGESKGTLVNILNKGLFWYTLVYWIPVYLLIRRL